MAIQKEVKFQRTILRRNKKTRQGSSQNTKRFQNKNSEKYTKPYKGQGRG